MIHTSQTKAAFGGDDLVEATVSTAGFTPDCAADAGQIRQGGLHFILPWLMTVLGA